MVVLNRRFDAIDAMKSKLARMDNESKAKHKRKVRQRKKCRGKEKTKLHRQRYCLRRCIRFTYRHVTRMVRDMHHKLSSWLATNYNQVLLPSFQTNEMVRKYEKLVAGDGTPATSSDEVKQAPAQGGKRQKRKREIRSSTARAMLAQSRYKFKMLLKYNRIVWADERSSSKKNTPRRLALTAVGSKTISEEAARTSAHRATSYSIETSMLPRTSFTRIFRRYAR